MANHLSSKRRRLQSNQTTLLGSSENEIQLCIIKITVSLWMWHEIYLTQALSCKKGGFVSLRHNHIRNITASLLTEVCKEVRVELLLQQLTGESLQNHTVRGDEVTLDICTWGFWKAGQAAFFDVRVFNPSTTSYTKLQLSKSYGINEKGKKKYYNERIM